MIIKHFVLKTHTNMGLCVTTHEGVSWGDSSEVGAAVWPSWWIFQLMDVVSVGLFAPGLSVFSRWVNTGEPAEAAAKHAGNKVVDLLKVFASVSEHSRVGVQRNLLFNEMFVGQKETFLKVASC